MMPSTYWIRGVLGRTMHNIPVECTISETARFDTPNGQTCESYAGAYARQAGGRLLNPGATTDCQYCPFSSGDDYLRTLNIDPSQTWQDFGIFLVFVFINYALVYFFIWSVRIKHWSFGFGHLFGFLGKCVDFIKKPFKKASAKKSSKQVVDEKTN